MELHHYLKSDIYNNFLHNCYDNYIIQNGGLSNGNDLQVYDYEIKGNHIFIGERKYACMDILIEDEKAIILWIGHFKNCLHWKNAKHMFLWGLIITLKNFPDIRQIELGDDTDPHTVRVSIPWDELSSSRADTKRYCDKKAYQLNKYYFLRYGVMYYELYFDFKVEFEFERKERQYKEALEKRKNSIITKNWVKKYLQEIKKIIPEFIELFEEKNEMHIAKYLSMFTIELKNKYCNDFYNMVDLYPLGMSSAHPKE